MKRLNLKSPKFKKKKTPSPQSKLLEKIFEAHGGIVEVAKKLKVSKQLVFIWRAKGYVPLSRVNEVAKVLEVPVASLNFKEYSKFMEKLPVWNDVLNSCIASLPLRF